MNEPMNLIGSTGFEALWFEAQVYTIHQWHSIVISKMSKEATPTILII